MPFYSVRLSVYGVATYWVEASTPEEAVYRADHLGWGSAHELDLDVDGRRVYLDDAPVEIDYAKLDELEMEGLP